MNRRRIVILSMLVISVITLLILLGGSGSTTSAVAHPRNTAPLEIITPTVTSVDPKFAFNDLEASIVITGADFTAELSDTLVLTSPIAYLGNTALAHVTWVNSTTLTATVPWGMDPGEYQLTVTNPDGGTGSLADAFTVQKGVGQWNGGGLYGGVGQQVLLKPGNPNTIYAMAYGVGIFRSRDAGGHWRFITSHIGGNATFAIDPLHPTWIYLNANDGLYRSQDEGDTWVKWLGVWPDGRSINMERAHPSPFNPQVIFVNSSGQPGDPLHGVLGLIKSTNGGASWQIVNGLRGIPVTDVAFHPTNPLRMVLGTQDGRVYQSADGGNTWSMVTKPPVSDVGTITYNPYRPDEVWISLGSMFASEGAGLYKSTNAAFTAWQDVTPAAFRGNPISLWCIKFTSADSVYTIKQHSDNGGLTWNWFGPWNGYGEISFDPANSQVGYIGDITYGVQKTIDGGQTWQIKNQGFAGMIAHQISASRFDPKRVYATFESWPGIYRSEDGANTWTYYPIENSINVRWVREDPLDSQRLYVAADSGFYVSLDGGESWSAKGWNVPPSSKTGAVNAFELDPYQPGHMLAGFQVGSDPYHTKFYGQLYSSNDYGVTWSPITVMPGAEQASIMDIKFYPTTPGLVYLSTYYLGLYRSTNSGSTWARIDDPNLYYMQWLHNITIATHPQPVLLVGDGSEPYRSWNGGNTWQNGQAPYAYGYSTYMFLNGDSTRLYAANITGLFLSSNAGTSWTRAAGVLGRLDATALGYAAGDNYTILYVATAGGDPGPQSNSLFPATGSASSSSVKSTDTPSAPLDKHTYLPLVLNGWPEPPNNLVGAGIYRYVQR